MASGALPRMCGPGTRRTRRRCYTHPRPCLFKQHRCDAKQLHPKQLSSACHFVLGSTSTTSQPSYLVCAHLAVYHRPDSSAVVLLARMARLASSAWTCSDPALLLLPQGMGVLMVGRTEAAASAAVLALQKALPASCHGCFLAFKVWTFSCPA